MKMQIEISESYTTGICTVWQTDHHRHGRRFTIHDPEAILSPAQYSSFLDAGRVKEIRVLVK